MENILKVVDINKKYLSKDALKNINIEIGCGKVVGLLGPNGSGKTTLIKLIAGLLKPSSGVIEINGKNPGVYTKSIVSYMPDKDFLYKWMRIRDALDFYNDFYEDFDMQKAINLLGVMKLNLNDKITSLSKGMYEKLNVTLTFSRRARLYVLDEPLGGIDPVARESIMDVILSSCRDDSSILISTHLVHDIERLFDEVIFISNGEIILQGDAEELRSRNSNSIDALYREVYKSI